MNQAQADVEAACRRIKAAYERGLITTHARVMAGVHPDLWATEAEAERDIELSGLEQLMRALEARQAAEHEQGQSTSVADLGELDANY